MSVEENKALIRRYLDAINGKPKTPEILDLFIAEQPLKDHIAVSEAAFPLYRIDPEEIIAEGDLVCLRGKVNGVNAGSFMGMPPTGKTVSFSIYLTYKVVGGRIIDHWMVADNMELMKQLGMLPVQSA